jgi:curli biogenesis system outer membrane secretion channel CsgG
MRSKWKTMGRAAAASMALAAALAAAPAMAQSKRPTVAILDLDYGTIDNWWGGNYDVGKGVADLIVDGLVEDGSYRVIERKRLDAILAEQNFSNSDRADPSAAKVAKLGKALGVKYLLVGSITKFGTENKDMKVGGGGWGGGKFGIGNVGTKKGKATVALTVRMIDSTTGEIMASAKGEGTSSRSGLLLGGGGGGGAGGLGGIEMGSSNFRETVLGEATEAAVKMVVTKLVAAKDRVANPDQD